MKDEANARWFEVILVILLGVLLCVASSHGQSPRRLDWGAAGRRLDWAACPYVCPCAFGGVCTCGPDCNCPRGRPTVKRSDDGGPDWHWDWYRGNWVRPAPTFAFANLAYRPLTAGAC